MSPSPEPQPTPADQKAIPEPPVTVFEAPEADHSRSSSTDPTNSDEAVALDHGVNEGEQRDHDSPEQSAEPPQDAWQAVFSPEANAWYFWNAQTGQTTWTNPRESSAPTDASSSSATDVEAGPSNAPPPAEPGVPADDSTKQADSNALPEIDPDLAWLDPALAARQAGSTGIAQTGRFHARTGRFMADPAVNPDRLSQFQRGRRQQEAYYNVEGWEQQLAGQGVKRAGEASEEAESAKRRPSTKQVEKFRQQKEEKKRKKLTSWLT